MTSISKIIRFFLLPLFVLTGVLLGASYAAKTDSTSGNGDILFEGANCSFRLKASDPSNPSGRLDYVDRSTGLVVRSTGITAYIVMATPLTRRIEGTAVLGDGSTVTFVVIVQDLGEPGSLDNFNMSLSNGYVASGSLLRGNIKVNPA